MHGSWTSRILVYKALYYNPIIASYVMYAIGGVLCTGTGHRTKGLSEHMHRSQSDRLLQGGSLIFLALFDFPCQGAYITCSIGYQFVWVRCDALRTGMGASDVSNPYTTPYASQPPSALYSIPYPLCITLCQRERIHARDDPLPHRQKSRSALLETPQVCQFHAD